MNVLKRVRPISPKSVPKLVHLIDYYGLEVKAVGIGGQYRSMLEAMQSTPCKGYGLSTYIYFHLKSTKLEITTKWLEGVPTTYVVALNGESLSGLSGLQAFKEMCKAYKLPKAIEDPSLADFINKDTGAFGPSAKPILGFNPEYSGQYLKDCWEYDLNSAYASVVLKGIPDLWHGTGYTPGKDVKVKPGWVGFWLDGDMAMVKPGGWADVAFPIIPCPAKLRAFIERAYNTKQNSKGAEKQRAKDLLNFPIGYCQRYNPFFRAYVVNSCNEVIEKLIDSDTLFWNTDAIFSRRRRPELDIGQGIGQFKEVPCKELAYKGNTYQIDGGTPVYRGVPKNWFKAMSQRLGRPYDLLRDGVPIRQNRWVWDWPTMKLEDQDGKTFEL